MFAGHFGLAATAKSRQPRVPLWALMLSTQLLDVVFAVLVIMHIEGYAPIAHTNGGYGESIINADYSHSLLGALLIALGAGLLAWKFWGKGGGLVISAVVFSHWILDLLVHRTDLAILPGNLGNFPRLGFGLWSWPSVSIALELALIITGGGFYFASALSRSRNAASPKSARTWAIIAGVVTCLFLLLSLVTDVTGIG